MAEEEARATHPPGGVKKNLKLEAKRNHCPHVRLWTGAYQILALSQTSTVAKKNNNVPPLLMPLGPCNKGICSFLTESWVINL